MRRLFILFLFLCWAPLLHADDIDSMGKPVDLAQIDGPLVRFKVDLAGAKDNVKIARLKDGTTVYIIKRLGSDSDRMLTADEFSRFYYEQQTEDRGAFVNFIFFLFNTTSIVGIAWVSIGLLGQAIFMGRMLVQWFASEKSKRSVIPISFWWMSLIGSTISLVYFIWRRDIVGILANATGWIVYIRNLVLIHRSRS